MIADAALSSPYGRVATTTIVATTPSARTTARTAVGILIMFTRKAATNPPTEQPNSNSTPAREKLRSASSSFAIQECYAASRWNLGHETKEQLWIRSPVRAFGNVT